ncbi:unnamed protein product [Closterium sp. NIES-64]|nr:unnamed protein product [Closterium sp. NIES-64]
MFSFIVLWTETPPADYWAAVDAEQLRRVPQGVMPEDGQCWIKYGEKRLVKTACHRSYFRCARSTATPTSPSTLAATPTAASTQEATPAMAATRPGSAGQPAPSPAASAADDAASTATAPSPTVFHPCPARKWVDWHLLLPLTPAAHPSPLPPGFDQAAQLGAAGKPPTSRIFFRVTYLNTHNHSVPPIGLQIEPSLAPDAAAAAAAGKGGRSPTPTSLGKRSREADSSLISEPCFPHAPHARHASHDFDFKTFDASTFDFAAFGASEGFQTFHRLQPSPESQSTHPGFRAENASPALHTSPSSHVSAASHVSSASPGGSHPSHASPASAAATHFSAAPTHSFTPPKPIKVSFSPLADREFPWGNSGDQGGWKDAGRSLSRSGSEVHGMLMTVTGGSSDGYGRPMSRTGSATDVGGALVPTPVTAVGSNPYDDSAPRQLQGLLEDMVPRQVLHGSQRVAGAGPYQAPLAAAAAGERASGAAGAAGAAGATGAAFQTPATSVAPAGAAVPFQTTAGIAVEAERSAEGEFKLCNLVPNHEQHAGSDAAHLHLHQFHLPQMPPAQAAQAADIQASMSHTHNFMGMACNSVWASDIAFSPAVPTIAAAAAVAAGQTPVMRRTRTLSVGLDGLSGTGGMGGSCGMADMGGGEGMGGTGGMGEDELLWEAAAWLAQQGGLEALDWLPELSG